MYVFLLIIHTKMEPIGCLNYGMSDGKKKFVDRDVNENYGSDYIGCLFNTCGSQNHVEVYRSAVLSVRRYRSAV